MENNAPQRESKIALVIVGILLIGMCAALIGLIYLVTTQSAEIARIFQTPFATPKSEWSATATVDATKIYAAQATRTAMENLPLVFEDAFDSNVNDWDIGNFDDDYLITREHIANGVLQIEAEAKKGFFALREPDIKNLEDFYVSADIQQLDGTKGSKYGIIFRSIDRKNFYWFGIRNGNGFEVNAKFDGEWHTLVSYRRSPAIHPTGVNHVAVSGRGSHFELFINDELVGSFDDEELARGGIGIGFQLPASDRATFAFDNFIVRGGLTQAERNHQMTATAMAPTLTAISALPIVMTDSFDKVRESKGWNLDTVKASWADGSRRLANGVYVWEFTAKRGIVYHSTPANVKLQDFVMAVDTRQTSGPTSVGYGIVFRLQDSDNYYRFGINQQKKFRIDARYKGNWFTFVNWTRNDAILPDGNNRIQIIAQGPHFVFTINGQYVYDWEDSRLTTGSPGLFIEMEQGEHAKFEFDNFELRTNVTPTPPFARTPTATATNTLQQFNTTPDAMVSTISSWRTIFADDLVKIDPNWIVQNISGHSFISPTIFNGGLTWTVAGPTEPSEAYSLAPSDPLTKYAVELDTGHQTGASDGMSGLVFDFVDENNYRHLVVDGEGQVQLSQKINGTWHVDRMLRLASNKPSQTHHLTVHVDEKEITSWVDGLRVDQVARKHSSTTRSGLTLISPSARTVGVKFANFRISTP